MEDTHLIILEILSFIPIFVLFLCIIDKLKLATSLSILFLSQYPFLLGTLFQFPDFSVESSTQFSPVAPYSIGILLLLIATASFLPQLSQQLTPPSIFPGISRWLLLLGGYIFHFIAIAAALIYWYTPGILGMNEPSPIRGVIAFNIGFLINAFLWHLASKKNSKKRPNLMRKIITILIVFEVTQTTLVLSFILIYAFPANPPEAYANEASYMFLSSLTMGLLLLLLNKETVEAKPSLKRDGKRLCCLPHSKLN